LQGEGIRAGTANIFVRFSGCNLQCNMTPGPKSPGSFDCDTEFVSGRTVSLDELWLWSLEMVSIALNREIKDLWTEPWFILTGGEPALQVDKTFCDYFHERGAKLAIETNGSLELPKNEGNYLLDWITLSPKVAEHAIKQPFAHELKYVRGYGQGIPKPTAVAEHYLISPAFDGNEVHPKTLAWCLDLVRNNPKWRLSVQQHKQWRIR
jgi:7-carboxy-7-deazaguanine synthase